MDQQAIEMEEKQYKPISCCSQGASISQILAIGLFVGILIINFNLIPHMIHLQSAVMHGLMAFSYITFVVLVVQYIRLCSSDPSDPGLFEKNYHADSVQVKQCEKCKSRVSVKSYHCQSCDRCAEDFDHHCALANNCIGKNNYPIFIRLLIAMILHTSTNIGISIWLFLTLKDSYKWMALSYCILNILFFVQATVLAIFHCYINFYLDKTTLQWIKEKEEQTHVVRIMKSSQYGENTQTQFVKGKKAQETSSTHQ